MESWSIIGNYRQLDGGAISRPMPKVRQPRSLASLLPHGAGG
jgi:hypothetical protein